MSSEKLGARQIPETALIIIIVTGRGDEKVACKLMNLPAGFFGSCYRPALFRTRPLTLGDPEPVKNLLVNSVLACGLIR